MTSSAPTIRVALVSTEDAGRASPLRTRLASLAGITVSDHEWPCTPDTLADHPLVLLELPADPRPMLELGRDLARQFRSCVLCSLPAADAVSAALNEALAALAWQPHAWVDPHSSDGAIHEVLRLAHGSCRASALTDFHPRQVLEAMDDIVVTLDRDLRNTAVYGQWPARYGVAGENILGRTIVELLGPEHARPHIDACREALTGRPVTYEWRLPNGERELHVQTRLSPIRGEDGTVVGLVGVGRDITAFVAARAGIDARDQRFRALSAQVPGAIYQYRMYPDGRSCFPFASDQIRAVYGVDPEKIREDAAAVFARLHPEDYDAVAASIVASRDSLEVWNHDYRVLLPDRGLRWLRGRATPERLPDGSVLWHGYITDITDLKRIETERATLFRELTHRVKNNLAMVASLLHMKASEMGDTGELNDLEHRVQTIATLHDHLAGSGGTNRVELQSYLQHVIDGALVGWAAPVQVELSAAELFMPSREATSLGLIVNELATNAVKYGFTMDEAPRFSCRLAPDPAADSVVMTVSNSGRPFPEGVDPAGAGGLGLQLVRMLVEQLDGAIRLERSPHTRFLITVPRQAFEAII